MNKSLNNDDNILEKALHYVQTSLELYQLKTIQKAAAIGSSLVSSLFIFTFIWIAFLIANIGLALWLGEVLGKSYLGFLCSAGLYLVLALIVYSGRKSLILKPFENFLLNLFVPNESNEKQ